MKLLIYYRLSYWRYVMSYNAECQARYNATKKGKARKRRWQQNMTPEQREKQRIAKREYMRRRRKCAKEEELQKSNFFVEATS